MWNFPKHPGFLVGGLGFLLHSAVSCGPQPDSPTSPADVGGRLSASQTTQVPEEEILGTVFESFGQRTTRTDLFVRLRAVGSGACIFTAGLRPSDPTTQCPKTLDMMPVLPGGSTTKPGVTTQWGWFDDLDTDNNPCNPSQLAGGTPVTEVHDLNGNRQPDETGPEQHCVTTGRYEVELVSGPQLSLSQGSILRRRTIDHVETAPGVFFNNRALEQAGTGDATDTFAHFQFGSVFVSMNMLKIDNPDTGTKFAAGDTLVEANVPVGFLSEAMTGSLGATTSPLLFRVLFDTAVPLERSEYANPDRIIRTHPYSETGRSKVASRSRLRPTRPTTRVGSPRSSAWSSRRRLAWPRSRSRPRRSPSRPSTTR